MKLSLRATQALYNERYSNEIVTEIGPFDVLPGKLAGSLTIRAAETFC